jgi:hypothetical protein
MLSETRNPQRESLQQDEGSGEFPARHAVESEREGRIMLDGCGTCLHANAGDAAPDIAASGEMLRPDVGRLLGTLWVRGDESWQDLVSLDGFDE